MLQPTRTGARFAPPLAPTAIEPQGLSMRGADGRPRLLLVDDEPLNIQVLAAALGDTYALSFATSGEEALSLLERAPEPALILLDVMMPSMDGFEVCARLKANSRTAGIPLIFLTGLNDPTHEERGLRTGAVDYIHKPLRPAIVRARVRLHVELRERTLELKLAQERLREQATRDELTGLPNRRAFRDQLQQTAAESRRHGRRFGVMAIDLDRFKPINDTHGHAAGDKVLKTIARRLRESLRDEDIVSRVGGDEFIVLLPDVRSADRVRAAAKRVLASVACDVALDNVTVQVGASVGVAMFPDVTDDVDLLLERADAACYEAKREGRNCYRIYAMGGRTRATSVCSEHRHTDTSTDTSGEISTGMFADTFADWDEELVAA